MKKVIFLFTVIAAVVLVGCKRTDGIKPDPPSPEPDQPKQEFSFTMKFNEKYKGFSNILVDNFNSYVWFNIKIKDPKREKNTTYIFKPTDKKDATKHHIFQKDFKMYRMDEFFDMHPVEERTFVDLSLDNWENWIFFQPLVPGTFNLEFQLQKYDTVAKKI